MTYKPHARVAGSTFRRIDEVDGVPTTHTQPGWVHAWTVTDGVDSAAPFPVAAKGFPAIVAVPAMCVLVLTCAAAALLVVLDGRPDRLQLMLAAVGLLVVWTVLLLVPAFVRGLQTRNASQTERSHDNGHRIENAACSPDHVSSIRGGESR